MGADGHHRNGALLIACANIANLVARTRHPPPERDGHPLGHRSQPGANRFAVVDRDACVERIAGGALGLLLAFWADKALMSVYLPADSARLNISTTPDLRILVFTFGVSALTALVFGLVPALQTTKPNVGTILKDEASAVVGSGNRGLRKSLVVAQVALSLLLLDWRRSVSAQPRQSQPPGSRVPRRAPDRIQYRSAV